MYHRACDGSVAGACFEAGRILDEATFMKQDLVAAASFYTRSCDAGDARGCFGLGRVSELGAGGEPDMDAARAAYERAIAAGSPAMHAAVPASSWTAPTGVSRSAF